MTKIAAQIPALFESLSGMQMSDLLGKVKTITDRSDAAVKPNGTVPQN
jgi:flotillin